MDDDVLEIDSPMEMMVEYEDSEDEADVPHLSLDAIQPALSKPAAAEPKMTKKAKMENRKAQLEYPDSLPYACETLEEFDARLDHVVRRLVDCVRTKDFDVGLGQWTFYLKCLMSLRYPMLRQTRARLARLYYELTVLPGLETRMVQVAAEMCMSLIENKKKLDIKDLVLPWKPLYNLLEKELFPKQRRTGLTNVSDFLLDLAEAAQRFFAPSEADEMLRTFLPKLDGSNINSVIASQAFLVHFLPISHPQRWLPAMFRLWESFNSSLFDDQMLDLLARLAEMHVSDPSISVDTATPGTDASDDVQRQGLQAAADTSAAKVGLFNEIGIFTESQFSLIMTKCLRSAGLPVGASKSANAALLAQSSKFRTGPDAAASGVTLKMKRQTDRLHSFAVIIAYSISRDGPVASQTATPSAAPTPAVGTPIPGESPHLGGLSGSGGVRTYPGGSKALDHMAKFIQATESFFHPSNHGPWQAQLSCLVQHLTYEFLKRYKEEERQDCKIPAHFRLTPEIKRELVSSLRTVCLLSMFSRDPFTMSYSHASLKWLAILEPELIIPAVLERSFDSLEALETTHRTNAIITALSQLSPVMVSREMYRAGGKHLTPLLQLCIPGIDLNDPGKTVSTCLFITLAVLPICIDDLTRSRAYADDEEVQPMDLEASGATTDAAGATLMSEEAPRPSPLEEDYQLRLSTADFEPWLAAFFKSVLALFEALPEEGRAGRVGGKLEERVIHFVMMATDAVCAAMSPYLFEKMFKIVADYCATTVSASVVKVIGVLIGCFARANGKLVLDRFVPLCTARIAAELENGASSTRTTSTSIPVQSDAALHWYLSVLLGATSHAGDALLPHQKKLLEVMQLMSKSCKTERGYSFAARLVQRVIATLVTIYPLEQRFVNADLWESSEFAKRSHLHWGRLYKSSEVKISWYQPSADAIDFALEVIDKVVQPALDALEDLLREGRVRDKVWSNDFCRNLMLVRFALAGMPGLIEEDNAGGGEAAIDVGDDVAEFIEAPAAPKCGFILTDRADPRYQKVAAFKARFGQLMSLAAQTTQDSGAEDQIDCVKLLIRSMRTYLTCYSHSSDDYRNHSKSLSFYRSITKLYAKQRAFPRALCVKRAMLYHASRARLNGSNRKRSPTTDKMIHQILEFCLSNYVAIRSTAQNTLETICSYYDGTRSLCFSKLIEAIQPGVSDDRMKGALYLLGSKRFAHLAVTDERFCAPYILGLLAAQHHSKPSIQKLVRNIISYFVVRFAEPSTMKSQIVSASLAEAADGLDSALPEALQIRSAEEQQQLEAVAAKRKVRTARIGDLHLELMCKVLEIAQSDSTHWAFSIFAARLLRALIRKDKPLTEQPAKFFVQQIISENPSMRRYSQAAVTKILYFLKLRTLCSSDEDLLLGRSRNPLKHVAKLPKPVPAEWTQAYIASFAEPIREDTRLWDKSSQGWLVWGEEETYYSPPPQTESIFKWDRSSKPALDAISTVIFDSAWWDGYFRHLSQEKERNYLSAETSSLIKSLFQVYGVALLPMIKPSVEAFISEKDRHKHRAAAELISGAYRGSKHWPIRDQTQLWEWLETLLPRIFKECTPDSQPAWQMCVEYMLQFRDPRRAMPLVRYVVAAAKDNMTSESASQSPWEQAKAQNLLRGALVTLSVKFDAWGADTFIKIYSESFSNHFQEVRSIISESLADLELLKVHPSFGSVDELLDACSSSQHQGSLLARPEPYRERFAQLTRDLAQWKRERRPTAHGTSEYDRAAMTALLWISTTLGDHRKSAMAGEAIRFLPHIFAMVEIHDNKELSDLARAVLTKISTYSHAPHDVEALVNELLAVTRSSNDSWRARLDSLPVLQVVYFQNLFYLNEATIQRIIELLLELLRDKHLEMREMAATTLSGIVRCSQRRLIQTLKRRFTKTVTDTVLPKRGQEGYEEKLLTLHSGILGATALLAAFPYEVPEWMPQLIVETVAQHTEDPVPISTTVRRCAADFKRTHQDTWSEDQKKFGPYLSEVNDFTLGRSDYFA
ncbi:Proteasome activator BLM10 [Thecaphora frezii]